MKTLLGVSTGWGKSTLAAYLVTHHRFVLRRELPRSMRTMAEGSRTVVVLGRPVTPHKLVLFEWRVCRLGGTVIRIDPSARTSYIGIPNPQQADGQPEAMFEAVDALLCGVDSKGRALRPVPSCTKPMCRVPQ